MIDELLADAGERMAKSVERPATSSARCAPGAPARRCSTAIVVDYYGAQTPLKQLATINAPEARLLTVQPYDQCLDQGDREGDHGVRRRADAEQRRQADPPVDPRAQRGAPQASWSRSSAHIAEEGRVAIRNIRRDVMHDLRELKDAGDVGADDEHRAEQRAAEAHRRSGSASSTAALKAKEEEILEV